MTIPRNDNIAPTVTNGNSKYFEYEQVRCYHDNRAAVQWHQLWGFVNENGEEVIPLRYQEVRSYSCGYAAVQLNNCMYWQYINTEGVPMTAVKFIAAGSFGPDGIAEAVISSVDDDFVEKFRIVYLDLEFNEYDFRPATT